MNARLVSSVAAASMPPVPPGRGSGSQYSPVMRTLPAPSASSWLVTGTGRMEERASSSQMPHWPLLKRTATLAMGSHMDGGPACRGTISPHGATWTLRTGPMPVASEEERPVEVSQRSRLPSASPSSTLVPHAASAMPTHSLPASSPHDGRRGCVSAMRRPFTASMPTRPSARANARRSSGYSASALCASSPLGALGARGPGGAGRDHLAHLDGVSGACAASLGSTHSTQVKGRSSTRTRCGAAVAPTTQISAGAPRKRMRR
mmetsp:Transcript_15372/g.39598  ORF Transcript_15372/g.39598 Transcript_15372/m.39598 type:complete len:262 (-) Transcript_15372:407-1192(-)